jgi:hypothetical protein
LSNTLYLTCKHHPSPAESFVVAERREGESFKAGVMVRLQKWLDRHAACGGTLDHFTAGYALTKDGDLPNPAPIANGVHHVLRSANEGQA